jgi:hypothetical protein
MQSEPRDRAKAFDRRGRAAARPSTAQREHARTTPEARCSLLGMTYKNVTAPKRVASLDGAIVGASHHRKLGTIALVANNPSGLVLVGASGSPVRVLGLTLDDPSDVALLSRDMAAVRSGSQVWSLVDLAHKPRVDPLVDDVKQLVGPQGDAAFALGWDNRGQELKPGSRDVDLRAFGLRGAHRAVFVGESETYAVVDGEGDGELRIHPGPTPEQGSLTKTALPLGAKKLDTLRAGKFVQALFRRGEPVACVVKRAGNRLDAKMVRIEGGIADAAVADDCLLVATSDGRLVLLDPAAIDAATASSLEPKSTTHVGADGQPTTLLVAGTSVFVGTSSGEVLLAQLVRNAAFY